MDIKQLKFLIALDQTRHFGQAAALCHITQPTLSMRLRNLEDELDLVLVKRGQRFEGFTEAGERILAWARTLLAAHDGLQAEAASCRGQVVGSLRLGTVPLASFNPMQLLLPLREKYPELQFQLSSHSTEQIMDGLSRNQLDLGICYLDQVNASFFEVIELGTTTMGLLHDTRHFQFEADSLRWEELGEIPLGLLSKGMHYRQSLDLSFRSRSLEPNAVLESDSSFQLIQAINTGVCCAIMPLDCGLEDLSDHMRILPIVDASIHSPVGLLLRRSEPRSAIAEQCFDEARALFQAP
ncbi:LysR family transcriptional regulator [Pseudomonas sp. P1B16]|jgi:Transcriptional regulator|uniref:LysR family transcriptional regulator n=1 Tax=Pseudomonas capeferrum TaxID=1495066 RepID=A0ABY7R5H5_9PSED|nr:MULTISPECIES: LysR family transcriptional regulator [Pseudomonas]KEY89866.1 LysR family transcriptional regulator [Pseudomonas capeferrum]KGI92442.1 LysR family transcriptional regulator [Pseudomonas sp. H2]MBC3481954.1 LysR family transcriptional regulator [Pseudomonas sp. SWRI77]MBC3504669.1 LysR family transcriptional regulator [Pseudomonas sp. SWRI59]MBC3509982.1 LysR family transcriptional regulator [Pseudomonas sp. SWRI68]